MLDLIQKEFKSKADPERAKNLQRFFKTGKGEYGEGDSFLGITVPEQRKIANKFNTLGLNDIQSLLKSNIHEQRFTALEILVMQYEKANEKQKNEIFKFYIKNTKNINNWDLVDTSAPYIIGDFLLNKNRKILYKLAKSKNIWEKRISIISTAMFIKNNQFQDTIKISEILLKDKHDLIQKAVGWMLREMGKKDKKTLEIFLKKHYKSMPRTMLRYSIEKFPEAERKNYLTSKI